MEAARASKGCKQDSFRLVVMLAAHQEGTLHGLDIHEHVFGFRGHRCLAGGNEPSVDFVRAA